MDIYLLQSNLILFIVCMIPKENIFTPSFQVCENSFDIDFRCKNSVCQIGREFQSSQRFDWQKIFNNPKLFFICYNISNFYGESLNSKQAHKGDLIAREGWYLDKQIAGKICILKLIFYILGNFRVAFMVSFIPSFGNRKPIN